MVGRVGLSPNLAPPLGAAPPACACRRPPSARACACAHPCVRCRLNRLVPMQGGRAGFGTRVVLCGPSAAVPSAALEEGLR
eukprot:12328745-Alexandrium_andersonii.AAC.1